MLIDNIIEYLSLHPEIQEKIYLKCIFFIIFYDLTHLNPTSGYLYKNIYSFKKYIFNLFLSYLQGEFQ